MGPPPRKSWVARHKVLTGILVSIVVLFVIGSISAALEPAPEEDTIAGGAPTLPAQPVPSGSDASFAPNPDPTTPDSSETAKSVIYRGRGDRVLKIKKPDDGPVILDARYVGTGNFIIRSSEESQLLVNTVGRYKGSTVLDEEGGDSTKLKIAANGQWTVRLRTVATAKHWVGSTKGTGDAVGLYEGKAGTIAFTHRGTGAFVIKTLAADGEPELAVNEIGNYKGEDTIDAGPVLIHVSASGSWTAKVTED